MATLKQRLHRKNASGTYDTIHFETSADLIVGSVAIANGGTGATTAANARTNLGITPANIGAAASSHSHAATDITSGTMNSARLPTTPVNKGGTGRTTLTSGYFLRGNGTGAIMMSSVDEVKELLGVDESSQAGVTMEILFETGALYNPTGETVADLNTSVAVGAVVVFDGRLWRVVHKSGTVAYLASLYWVRNTQFDSGGSTAYAGSDLASVAMSFQNSMSASALAQCNNTTVNGVSAKVFVCSYEQANGGFSYFNSNSRRILYNTSGDEITYWTSSPYSSGTVWFVNSVGGLYGDHFPTDAHGFRPFVALRLS